MWLENLIADLESERRLRDDLEYFAGHGLRIRPKAGALVPLAFNAAQRELHAVIEQQKKELGRVRAVVLKGRQMGISTYIGARLFHRTIKNPGLRTFILAHDAPASAGLFQIVKRYYENLPEEMKPTLAACNA